MRVVLFAYGSLGSKILEKLLDLRRDVVLVLTHPDDPREAIWFHSVEGIANEARIPVIRVPAANPRGPVAYHGAVKDARPDLILSATFRALIPQDVLALAQLGALNFHPSLLPRYRGRCPVNWVLVRGEVETGMTLHHMVNEPDAGDIVGQIRLAIGPDETAPALQSRMEEAAVALLERYLPEIEAGTAPRIPQNEAESSTFGRRRPTDGRFEWIWSARRIHDLVRAVTRPYPGAFVDEPDGTRLFVWKTRCPKGGDVERLRPGEIRKGPHPGHLLAGTGDGNLEILEWERREPSC
jgi:methionyl-tRNA formyltransferase